MSSPKKIVLLGATGSIGENTLRVVRKHPEKLELLAIAGRKRWQELARVAKEFNVPHVAIYDEQCYAEAKASGEFPAETQLYGGLEGLIAVATLAEARLVVPAVVGTLALKPTLAALEQGKDIALASKEILVLAGHFVMETAKKHGSLMLPLDSEHNAIFQCLQGEREVDVDRLILTASGGPFRDFTREQMAAVTKEMALKHPNWDMGPKITIDSSTMANKGLELIEARWLFDMPADRIDVVIHPQSIVHSMVQYVDGSIIAQLSPPIMTFAIQHTLLYPERGAGVDATLDFSRLMQLDFRPPCIEQFPCLRLAREAALAGGIATGAFNAANEIAVDAFVTEKIGYLDIARVIEQTLESIANRDPDNLEALLAADTEAREIAAEKVAAMSATVTK